MSVDKLIDDVIAREGGYVNDPDDPGGETIYGITKATARRNGYAGAMRTMPMSSARSIYFTEYFTRPGFHNVQIFYPKVAEELFDTGVNMGVAVAAGFLQRALNALNNQGKLYPDIIVDNSVGPRTINALKGYHKARGAEGEWPLVRVLDAYQGERYSRIVEGRPASEKYFYGWIDKRLGNVL